MERNKILITINSLDDIDYYNNLGLYNIVYPLDNFCVGYPNTFSIEEIPNNSYIIINRVLDTLGIDNFINMYNKYAYKIKGIIFEDLGILEVLKNENIEKILYLSHFNANIESIKLYLNYVSSVIISTDINKKELDNITSNINNLTIFSFGYIPAMYSRRKLITNYQNYHQIKCSNPLVVVKDNTSFLVYENDFGTVFYHNLVSDFRFYLEDNVKYYFVNMVFLDKNKISDIIEKKEIDNTDNGFLDKELICKIKGDLDV